MKPKFVPFLVLFLLSYFPAYSGVLEDSLHLKLLWEKFRDAAQEASIVGRLGQKFNCSFYRSTPKSFALDSESQLTITTNFIGLSTISVGTSSHPNAVDLQMIPRDTRTLETTCNPDGCENQIYVRSSQNGTELYFELAVPRTVLGLPSSSQAEFIQSQVTPELFAVSYGMCVLATADSMEILGKDVNVFWPQSILNRLPKKARSQAGASAFKDFVGTSGEISQVPPLFSGASSVSSLVTKGSTETPSVALDLAADKISPPIWKMASAGETGKKLEEGQGKDLGEDDPLPLEPETNLGPPLYPEISREELSIGDHWYQDVWGKNPNGTSRNRSGVEAPPISRDEPEAEVESPSAELARIKEGIKVDGVYAEIIRLFGVLRKELGKAHPDYPNDLFELRRYYLKNEVALDGRTRNGYANMLKYGVGGPMNAPASFEQFRIAAVEQKDVFAQLNYGDELFKRRRIREAAESYRNSADQGLLSGQHAFGLVNLQGETGEGVNYSLAREYFHKAALQGDAESKWEYAMMLIDGLGKSKEEPMPTRRELKLARDFLTDLAQIKFHREHSVKAGLRRVNKMIKDYQSTTTTTTGGSSGGPNKGSAVESVRGDSGSSVNTTASTKQFLSTYLEQSKVDRVDRSERKRKFQMRGPVQEYTPTESEEVQAEGSEPGKKRVKRKASSSATTTTTTTTFEEEATIENILNILVKKYPLLNSAADPGFSQEEEIKLQMLLKSVVENLDIDFTPTMDNKSIFHFAALTLDPDLIQAIGKLESHTKVPAAKDMRAPGRNTAFHLLMTEAAQLSYYNGAKEIRSRTKDLLKAFITLDFDVLAENEKGETAFLLFCKTDLVVEQFQEVYRFFMDSIFDYYQTTFSPYQIQVSDKGEGYVRSISLARARFIKELRRAGRDEEAEREEISAFETAIEVMGSRKNTDGVAKSWTTYFENVLKEYIHIRTVLMDKKDLGASDRRWKKRMENKG